MTEEDWKYLRAYFDIEHKTFYQVLTGKETTDRRRERSQDTHPLKPIIRKIARNSPKLQVEIPKFLQTALCDVEPPDRQKSDLKLPPSMVAFKKNV